jgi:hypothetical protein
MDILSVVSVPSLGFSATESTESRVTKITSATFSPSEANVCSWTGSEGVVIQKSFS